MRIIPNITIYKYNFNKHKLKNKKLNLPFLSAVLMLFIFTAFRFNIGWDYMAYYNTIEGNAITNIISNGEYLNIFPGSHKKRRGISWPK